MKTQEMNISIHAPPRGATLLATETRNREKFQFTPLREGRHFLENAEDAIREFQFTPLREGRQARVLGKSAETDFNSRPSARGDSRR